MQRQRRTPIRSWGCNRAEAPLIFVHVGKAGGGNVRARLAASAINYNRTSWKEPSLDDHFFSVTPDVRARFCNNLEPSYRNPLQKEKGRAVSNWRSEYRGLNLKCNASTPLGMIVGCPNWLDNKNLCEAKFCEVNSTVCGRVYVGHNLLGSEAHWLPFQYLRNWWRQRPFRITESSHGVIDSSIQTLAPGNRSWCLAQHLSRPASLKETLRYLRLCDGGQASVVDSIVGSMFLDGNYAPLWASLPVQRVTLLRDPFSWLLSKFFWHKRDTLLDCDDLEAATTTDGQDSLQTGKKWNRGWAYQDALQYIFFLCGEDCILRFEHGLISLSQLEAQAADNLRTSIAVVGILEQGDTIFHDMISARVSYVDMELHPEVTGDMHSTKAVSENTRCAALYQTESFQDRFKAALPELAALNRLYKLGVEVSLFQQNELRQCSAHFAKMHPSDG